MGPTFPKTICLDRFLNGGVRWQEEGSCHSNSRRKGLRSLLLGFWAIFFVLTPSVCRGAETGPPAQKTIIELQPFRQTTSIPIKDRHGREGRATLVSLNPRINDWFLLELNWSEGTPAETYHLENRNPAAQNLLLDSSYPQGLIVQAGQNQYNCNLWGDGPRESLREARASGVSYAPLCDERLYLRNPAKGHRTRIEVATDFLRDEVPSGEKIVAFVRDTFFRDAYQETGKVVKKPGPRVQDQVPGGGGDGPGPARIDPRKNGLLLEAPNLGIQLEGATPRAILPGVWYPAKENPGIDAGVIIPGWIPADILRSYRSTVANLDRVEAESLVYLVAFDLSRFDLKFSLGTEHPRVNWSDRIPDRTKDDTLPGPDGIGTIAPLVSTGLISPRDASRTTAAFTGGFKRSHGAFKWGILALKNHGSHYGFIENGVVFSKLCPGLSTVYRLADGWVDLKTWEEKDSSLLPAVRYARQNGVPIISGLDPATRMSVPGSLVSRWGEGNWSGSAEEKLRTLRAGAALQEAQGKRFLVYAVFTSATPSAMARVFQAYHCRYAMLLDMNALEHTYLAVYRREGPKLYVQHLIKGMEEVDKMVKGQYVPRFLGYPDNRDFFYLLRKEPP
jgi:hypothetical protein